MVKYLAVAKKLLIKLRAIKIELVGKDINSHADALAGLVSIFEGESGRSIAVELISDPSLKIQQESILINNELGPSWMDLIVNFMQNYKLPENKREAHKIWVKATRF